MTIIDKDTAALLLEEAGRINRPAFISDDPVQFPRRFSDLRDIEIASFLTAAISWGKRPMILRDADRMLALMDHQPYKYMMEEGWRDLNPDLNIHRTFFGRNLQWYLRGLKEIYDKWESLDAFSAALQVGKSDSPAWQLVEHMLKVMTDANNCMADSRCLPTNLKTSALKRVNMALRWLVRDDGIVDMGVWKSIPKEKLFIPLDVHVGNTARALGLMDRKSNDRKAAEQVTAAARKIIPSDPALLDYALFGIGIQGKT